MRLLLLRPVLSTFITTDHGDGSQLILFGSLLSHRIFLQCAIVCVKVAQEAIDTIHTRETASPGETQSLSVWWYNVLFLYTSATVLIAARLSPSILSEISEESILDRWHKAMDVLEGYGAKFGTSIHRLTTTLRLLFGTVPQQYARLRQQSHPDQTHTVQAPDNPAQHTATTPYWRPMESAGFSSSASYAPARDYTLDTNIPVDHDLLTSEDMIDFDAVFDPNDFSWLMTVPLNN